MRPSFKRHQLTDRVLVGEDVTLKILIEGKKPRCFKYGRKSYIRADCDTGKKEENGNIQTFVNTHTPDPSQTHKTVPKHHHILTTTLAKIPISPTEMQENVPKQVFKKAQPLHTSVPTTRKKYPPINDTDDTGQ